MKERRKTRRYKVLLNVSYTNSQGYINIHSNSISKNLSEGGVCILVNRAVKPGTKLKVELDIPGQDKTISAMGKVMWVKQNGGKLIGDRDAGVKFIKMSDSDHQKILSYIHILEENGRLNHITFKNNLAAAQAAMNLIMFVLKKVLSNV